MYTITRNLDAEEQQVLADYLKSVEDTSKGKLNIKELVVFPILMTLSVVHLYLYGDSKFVFVSVITVIIGFVGSYYKIQTYFDNKKEAKEMLPEIMVDQIGSTISVIPVEVSRAIKFEGSRKKGAKYLFEMPGGICFYLFDWDYDEDPAFPCSRFEIYKDDFIKEALGSDVKILGEPISPIFIEEHIKDKYFEGHNLPLELTPFDGSFDDILKRLEQLAKY
ncbi:MAG: hypothetical protein AB8F95_17250 [Bacteroidia bacterium]